MSAMKAYGETRGTDPRILYLRTNWRRVAFTLLKWAVLTVNWRLRKEKTANSHQNARKITLKFICGK